MRYLTGLFVTFFNAPITSREYAELMLESTTTTSFFATIKILFGLNQSDGASRRMHAKTPSATLTTSKAGEGGRGFLRKAER